MSAMDWFSLQAQIFNNNQLALPEYGKPERYESNNFFGAKSVLFLQRR